MLQLSKTSTVRDTNTADGPLSRPGVHQFLMKDPVINGSATLLRCTLAFLLNWDAGFATTDLNLLITSPKGDTITSLNTAVNPTFTGGMFGPDGDQVGGFLPPYQPVASEAGGWLVDAPDGSFPPGTHTIAAVLEGGQLPASAALTVLRDGVVVGTIPLNLDQQIDDGGVVKQAAIVEVTAE